MTLLATKSIKSSALEVKGLGLEKEILEKRSLMAEGVSAVVDEPDSEAKGWIDVEKHQFLPLTGNTTTLALIIKIIVLLYYFCKKNPRKTYFRSGLIKKKGKNRNFFFLVYSFFWFGIKKIIIITEKKIETRRIFCIFESEKKKFERMKGNKDFLYLRKLLFALVQYIKTRES